MKSFERCAFASLMFLATQAMSQAEVAEAIVSTRGASDFVPTILETRHLTNLSTLGNEYGARLSTDGRQLYYLSDQSGKVRLYLADRVEGSVDFENPRLFEFASGSQPDNLLSFELAEADVAMLVIVEGPNSSSVHLKSTKDSGVFSDPTRIALRSEDGTYTGHVGFSDVQANGNRLVDGGSVNHKHATWLQDPAQEGRFLYNQPAVYDDKLERLCSADFGGRVWFGDHGFQRPRGVHAAWGIPAEKSVYQLYNDSEASANFYWQEFVKLFPQSGFPEELSQDGTLLVVCGTRDDSIGGLDLYTLNLQAPLAVRQAAIADYIVTSPTDVDPLDYDENETFDVDSADVQSVTQP